MANAIGYNNSSILKAFDVYALPTAYHNDKRSAAQSCD